MQARQLNGEAIHIAMQAWLLRGLSMLALRAARVRWVGLCKGFVPRQGGGSKGHCDVRVCLDVVAQQHSFVTLQIQECGRL